MICNNQKRGEDIHHALSTHTNNRFYTAWKIREENIQTKGKTINKIRAQNRYKVCPQIRRKKNTYIYTQMYISAQTNPLTCEETYFLSLESKRQKRTEREGKKKINKIYKLEQHMNTNAFKHHPNPCDHRIRHLQKKRGVTQANKQIESEDGR